MKKKTLDTRSILKSVYERREKKERANVTFSFTKRIYKNFQEACGKQKVGAGEILEEFMIEFISSHGGR